jgi:hypothetical protein
MALLTNTISLSTGQLRRIDDGPRDRPLHMLRETDELARSKVNIKTEPHNHVMSLTSFMHKLLQERFYSSSHASHGGFRALVRLLQVGDETKQGTPVIEAITAANVVAFSQN